MAAVTSRLSGRQTCAPENEDLSDEQMQELLEQAAARLRTQATSAQITRQEEQVFRFPRLDAGALPKSYVRSDGHVAHLDSARLLTEKDRKLSSQARKVEDPITVKKAVLEKKKATTGSDWFDLPRTDLTPGLKRDLQLLKMRNVLDPHRHYKKESGKMKAPEFSQVGTILQGPTEYFSARIQNRDRKKTFIEEVLSGEAETGRFKKKYGEIQNTKTSGKKAFYKALKAKRAGGIKKR
ncbi:dTDP-fucopyranose mutase [Elasticomyces elasticus]|nr:hypothetical protein LTR28_000439 [Elasticomyces elasticus]KAK4997541.1 dTDP-fucopyranose mutase [Elasticomyces elasticus]